MREINTSTGKMDAPTVSPTCDVVRAVRAGLDIRARIDGDGVGAVLRAAPRAVAVDCGWARDGRGDEQIGIARQLKKK